MLVKQPESTTQRFRNTSTWEVFTLRWGDDENVRIAEADLKREEITFRGGRVCCSQPFTGRVERTLS